MPRTRPAAVTALLTAALAALVALTGCSAGSGGTTAAASEEGLHGTDVSDVVELPDVRLVDTQGTPVRLAPSGDDVRLLFFGYTRCTDICPATAADLAAARRRLPAGQREHVSVVFVDVDQAHDTPATVRSWLDRFDPSFTAALGSQEQTDALLTALHAPTTHDEAGEPAHTGLVYALSRGRTIAYTGGTTGSDYAADVEQLLAA